MVVHEPGSRVMNEGELWPNPPLKGDLPDRPTELPIPMLWPIANQSEPCTARELSSLPRKHRSPR